MPYLLETRNLLEISVNTEVVRASSSAWRTIQDEKTNGLGPGQTPYFTWAEPYGSLGRFKWLKERLFESNVELNSVKPICYTK